MKFVTEMELRDLYGKEPYAEYVVEKGTRLTPGARQFLVDRGIQMIDACASPIKGTNPGKAVKPAIATAVSARLSSGHVPRTEKKAASEAAANTSAGKLPGKDWRYGKLHSIMLFVESEFLRAEEELLTTDIVLAQRVAELGKQFRNICAAVKSGDSSGIQDSEDCMETCNENFCAEKSNDPEITEFHVQLPNGRTIVSLFALRAALCQIEPAVYEYCEQSKVDERKYCMVASKTGKILNAVTQLIYETVGGEKCLRKT